jgi:hypothetical protein
MKHDVPGVGRAAGAGGPAVAHLPCLQPDQPGNELRVANLSGPDWAGHPPIGANLRNGHAWDFAVTCDVANTNPTTLQLNLVDLHGHPIPGQPGATLAFHVDQWGNPSVSVTDARVGVIPTVHGTNIYIGQTGGA